MPGNFMPQLLHISVILDASCGKEPQRRGQATLRASLIPRTRSQLLTRWKQTTWMVCLNLNPKTGLQGHLFHAAKVTCSIGPRVSMRSLPL